MADVSLCPGLFYATPAQDGILSRVRVPGGLLTVPQAEAIAALAEAVSGGLLQITNRANVQLRTAAAVPPVWLARLQSVGLAGRRSSIDHLRNVMISPTAGIDAQALIDTRPWVQQWSDYLEQHPELSILSAKFSVGLAGGEAVCVGDRPNDICFVAALVDGVPQFQLHLSGGDRGAPPRPVGVQVSPFQALPLLGALAEVYRQYTADHPPTDPRRPPRLRHLLQDWGVESYLQAVERCAFPLTRYLPSPELHAETTWWHIGPHAQQQAGLSYLGVGLPLGRLTAEQLRGLAIGAGDYGSGTLRLTPWQTVLIPDVPTEQMGSLVEAIAPLGLTSSAHHPWSGLVACAGKPGCRAAATDTQGDALALAEYLEQHISLDGPVNIHMTGCDKSCAQHGSGDVTLLGEMTEQGEVYHIYLGRSLVSFGRDMARSCPVDQVPNRLVHLLRQYQTHRQDPTETLGDYCDRQSIADLTTWLDASVNPALHRS